LNAKDAKPAARAAIESGNTPEIRDVQPAAAEDDSEGSGIAEEVWGLPTGNEPPGAARQRNKFSCERYSTGMIETACRIDSFC
jgi:hypothetical protein